MKNLFKGFGIIAIITIIGFSMVACSGDDDSDNNNSGSSDTGGQSDYYGTWRGANLMYTISSNIISIWDSNTYGGGFARSLEVNKLTWTEYANPEPEGKYGIDYPKGYVINGKVSYVKSAISPKVGDDYTFCVYINKNDKKYMFRGTNDSPHKIIELSYKKL